MRRSLWSLARLCGLVILVGVGLDVATLWVPARPAPPSQPRQAAADTWLDIRRPLPLYGLTGTDFAKLPLDYAAMRNMAGDRRDILTFGDVRGDKGWLRLALYRVGGEAAPLGTAAGDFQALARDVAGGLSELAAPTPLSTRFGAFEATDLRLATDAGPTPCLGFRSARAEDAVLRVSGLVCGGAHPVGRDLLGCIVDRIDLLSAGDDGSLRDLFVAAERRRGSACMPAALTRAASRTTWLDANTVAPVLKP